ncbi:MAG: purine-binding chemotaxis protein CheW [Clostridiales bacterium]|nr:purine-binding chemotaxis protein CheW [Clostridiales bacterium]
MSTKQTVFRVNGEEYGLDIMDVSTVEKDLKIIKLSNTPVFKNVKGKTNLRGEEIPVYSLRRKFGYEDKEVDDETRYLITNVNGKNIAIEVDNVKGINDIQLSDIYEVPSIIKCNRTSYVKSIADVDDSLVVILDTNNILDKEETKALQA